MKNLIVIIISTLSASIAFCQEIQLSAVIEKSYYLSNPINSEKNNIYFIENMEYKFIEIDAGEYEKFKLIVTTEESLNSKFKTDKNAQIILVEIVSVDFNDCNINLKLNYYKVDKSDWKSGIFTLDRESELLLTFDIIKEQWVIKSNY